MSYLDEIDSSTQEFGELYDELPLWSASFGLMLLERVPIAPALTILDVGAGTGWLTIELAERCGEDATVIAVDPWTVAMDRLGRKAHQRRLANIQLLVQDASTLDLPDESIDLITSNLGINNFADPSAVLQTCFRVARPGATLLMTTNLVGHMAEFYAVYRAVFEELGQPDRLLALDAHINHRGTVDSVRQRVEAAGFAVTEVATDTFTMRFANGSSLLRHSFIRMGFLPAWKTVAADAIGETFTLLERRLNEVAAKHGELALTIPMACVVAHKAASS